jgi:uncharacterized membrane protein
MEKMLVAVFDNETQAFEGLSALKELHKSGDISLYANAVVSVDEGGKPNVRETTDIDGLGTATGLLVGSMVGIIGGPVGLAIGAGTGTMAGLAADINHDNVNADFVDEVSGKLTIGKTALIAEIDETWTVPVDTRLAELDGIVFRRLRYEVEDDQLRRESEAIVAEYDEWREEMKEGIDADKARMSKAFNNMKEKAQITKQQIEKKSNEIDNELNAKLDKMEQQMRNAGERRKARLQKRISALKEEYRIRREKLQQASRLISEAFGVKKEEVALVV